MPKSSRESHRAVKVKEEKFSPRSQQKQPSKSSRRRHGDSSTSNSESDRENKFDHRGGRYTMPTISSKIHSSSVGTGSRHTRRRSGSDTSDSSPPAARRPTRRSPSESSSSASDRVLPTRPKRRSNSPEKGSRHRRSVSGSPVRRRRSVSGSPVRRRRSVSGSPVRRRRSVSGSPAQRRRSVSGSPVRRRRSPSGSPVRRRRLSPGSPVRRPARQPRSISGSPARCHRSVSGSPVRRRRPPSDSPVRRRRPPSDSPVRRRRSTSRSPGQRYNQRQSPAKAPTKLSLDGRRHGGRITAERRQSSSSDDSNRGPPAKPAYQSTVTRVQQTRPSDHRRLAGESHRKGSCGSESESSDDRQHQRDSSSSSDEDSDSQYSDARKTSGKQAESESSSSANTSPEVNRPPKDKRKSSSKKKKKSKSSRGVGDRRGSPTAVEVSKNEEEGWILGKLKQLQEAKVAKRGSRKKEKEIEKLMETPEEKRLRRLLKKEAKERKRKERMGWDKDYMHYTNTDNPFGDANLLETFVWQKKLERDGIKDVPTEILEQRSKMKQEENKHELEKVKKRRLEREQERAQRDEEMTRMQSQKEAAQFMEWEKQEDTFHLQQALLRSKIRIEDGRAKPIDLLAKYISTEDEDLAVEMHEPYTYLNGLTIRDLEDLLEDIKVYMELEKGKNLDYWNDITIIVDDELYKLRKVDAANREHFGDRREGIHVSVNSEVNSVFKGKTHSQLAALHNQIIKKITGGEEGIDIGYWESLLSQLKAQMARARLRDRHQENLRRKLFQLKQEQGVESEPTFPITDDSGHSPSTADATNAVIPSPPSSPKAGPSKPQSDSKFMPPPEMVEENEDSDQQNDFDTILTEEDLREHSMEEYVAGCYSPKLTRLDALEPGTLLIDPYDDAKCLDYARNQLIGTGRLHSELTPEERAFEMEARTGMNDDEAMFSVETPLDHKMYLWSDKYRPRKPRYFNRVHTGFEWNKYNQTHYDMDNPPPKIVQGYKFNIFYPDLIDKGITPEYTLTPCPDNKDFAILRFHAGPPYEDIAFKIVNREWEYSYKRGFRCQFHNNIFQLWFHFKRYRYRR